VVQPQAQQDDQAGENAGQKAGEKGVDAAYTGSAGQTVEHGVDNAGKPAVDAGANPLIFNSLFIGQLLTPSGRCTTHIRLPAAKMSSRVLTGCRSLSLWPFGMA
jgi:hypothetical protein